MLSGTFGMDKGGLQPPLPPKGRVRPVPLPIAPGYLQPALGDPADQLSSSAPNETSHMPPASFLNPLYYHSKAQRSSSIGEASMHFVGPQRIPTNPVIKFNDSDSDSVYSAESVSSHSVKSDRYVEGPIVTMRPDRLDHEYELCEIDRPKVKDIFDLVSFKSPLYGSIRKEKPSEPPCETYDVPFKDPQSELTFAPLADTSEVYDVPSRHPHDTANKSDVVVYADENIESDCDFTYDVPASAILGFDAEILCDVDGMLPPPYPPPPPPVEIDELVMIPKVPPRPLLPPPVPKRPCAVQSLAGSNRVPSPAPVCTGISSVPKNIPSTSTEPQIIAPWTKVPLRNATETVSVQQRQVSARPESPNTNLPVSCNPQALRKMTNPYTQMGDMDVRKTLLLNTSVDSCQTSRLSKNSFASLPRFKKLAKTLSDLSLRNSTTALSRSVDQSDSHSDTGLECSSQLPDENTTRSGVSMSGYLFKISTNRKEMCRKWYALERDYLYYQSDPKADIYESRITKRSIVGVSTIPDTMLPLPGASDALSEMWCFRVFTVNNHHLLLGTRLISECKDWVRHLAEFISPPGILSTLDPRTEAHFAGLVHVKEGVSGKWQKGFLVLLGRWVHIWLQEISTIRRINLQTVAAIEKESSLLQCISAVERGPVFHMNLSQGVLYVQGDWALYTESLLHSLRREWALPSRAKLSDHYLTPEGLPLIVDKCLKFVATHGTMLEGIYRLSGSSSKVRQLLECLMQDVWQVHLKTDDYSPHDVASTLKRFLRSLPECLLTEKLYLLWVESSRLGDQVERLERMRDLLSHLPEVNYTTLKKLIGHLCMITEHSKLNLMPAMNLAPVFGPTLLFGTQEEEAGGLQATTSATDTVADLICFYTTLFQVDAQEMERERNIQIAVQKMKESRIVQKPAGDILVGIYIYSKDWGKCINVRLTPTTTAREICEYALGAGNIMEPLTKIALMEVVCDGALERPIHYSEFVLGVTLRWMTWNQEEAKDNYFCIKHNHVHDAILPVVSSLQGQALSVFGELSFADSNSKSFKKLHFEFTSAKLRCYKNTKNVQQVIGEWNVEDITWYLGSEPKRPPSTKWTFTFVDRNAPVKRTKSSPFFGKTISCRSEDELHKWVAAMLVGEYPQGLVPTICLPDLLT